MPSDREQVLLARRFQGINLTQDSAFVDPSYLQSSNNWITSPTFLLSKRPGTTHQVQVNAGGSATPPFIREDALIRVYDRTGTNRYLYGVAVWGGGVDGVWVYTNDTGAITAPTGSDFASGNKRYDSAVLGERVYFGNGTDPLKYVPIGGSNVDLTSLNSFVYAPVTATTADPSASLA